MKIEIGESLVYSWLRHVKQCQIVQTNWKASQEWPSKDINLLDSMRKEIEDEFKDTGLNIFQNSSTCQLLQQAEIDAVGVSHVHGDDGQIHRCYHFVDVAFHEGGLNYGPTKKTIARVLKKFIRSYFIYRTYFDDGSKGVFYFITPKMSADNLWSPMQNHLLHVAEVFKKRFGQEPDFQLLANRDFYSEVLVPTTDKSDGITDTTELFLRSFQLWKMFDGEPKTPKSKLSVSKIPPANPADPPADGEEKIGQRVQSCLQFLIDQKKLDGGMINKLLNAKYSKDTFNLNFQFLRRMEQGRFDEKDFPRYYSKVWEINGTSYYFCSQWYKGQRSRFDAWFNEVIEK